jgi:hypothetical protein
MWPRWQDIDTTTHRVWRMPKPQKDYTPRHSASQGLSRFRHWHPSRRGRDPVGAQSQGWQLLGITTIILQLEVPRVHVRYRICLSSADHTPTAILIGAAQSRHKVQQWISNYSLPTSTAPVEVVVVSTTLVNSSGYHLPESPTKQKRTCSMMLDGERGTHEWGSSPIARTVVDDLAWFASLIVRASLSAVNRQVTSLPTVPTNTYLSHATKAYKRARDSEHCLSHLQDERMSCQTARLSHARNAGTATTPQSCTSACQGWRLKACAYSVASHSRSLALQSAVCSLLCCSSYRWLGKTLSQLAWRPRMLPTCPRARMAGQAAASDK